ncbi:hypothetical protein HXX76_007045 [Chlamydomonas incerta]|uniref:Uncharacterized protein n=1 Tax=Chlamydomonas incerta TaxID=51695 RepID=A0A835W1I2_CHLIN|nr:hypothetical protein HXX76_007045 [Chlamydomonas incerta]|eukprot:KAG2435850.1 hypothetical protein HXX76_007045 [Chlamydomonas incerta]
MPSPSATCPDPSPGLAPLQRQGSQGLEPNNKQAVTEQQPASCSTSPRAGPSESARSFQGAVAAAAWRLLQAMAELRASVMELDGGGGPEAPPAHVVTSSSEPAVAAAAHGAQGQGLAPAVDLEDLGEGQRAQLRGVLEELLIPPPSEAAGGDGDGGGGGGGGGHGGQGEALLGGQAAEEEGKKHEARDDEERGGGQEADSAQQGGEEAARQPADEAEAFQACWSLWLSCGAESNTSAACDAAAATAARSTDGGPTHSPHAVPPPPAAAATAVGKDAPPGLPPLAAGPCGLRHPGFLPCGVLRRPYSHQLAWAVAAWRQSGQFPYPAVTQQRPPLLKEGEAYHSAVAALEALLLELFPEQAAEAAGQGEVERAREGGAQQVEGAAAQQQREAGGNNSSSSSSSSSAQQQQQQRALARLLLQPQLLYVLLGFRLTAGSATARLVAPLPSAAECVAAFERRHAPPGSPSVLTVGARALTKHCHRDLRGEWWPCMSGSEASKNQVARDMLSRLMSGAVWINLHQLPPFDAPRYVLEMRNEQGYGARWAVDPPTVAHQAQAAAAASKAAAAAAERASEEAQGAVAVHEAPAQSLAEKAAPPHGAEAATAPAAADVGEDVMLTADALLSAVPAAPPAPPVVGQETPAAARLQPRAAAGKHSTQGPGTNKGAGGGASTAGAGAGLPPPAVSFRGFLEPQMSGGHELGWRH